MRTTIRLDDDISAAAQQLRQERGLSLADAINELARAGLSRRPAPARQPFRQRTQSLGFKVDVSRNGEVLDLMDEPLP